MNTSLTVRLEGECFVDGQLKASVSHSGVTGEPKLGTHLINNSMEWWSARVIWDASWPASWYHRTTG